MKVRAIKINEVESILGNFTEFKFYNNDLQVIMSNSYDGIGFTKDKIERITNNLMEIGGFKR